MNPKINTTKNHALFSLSVVNRGVDLKKHAKLKKSMQKHGFLSEYPIVCERDKNKNLIIIDGQHRYTFARELGLAIHWVEATQKYDIATVNSGQVGWVPRDFAETYSNRGFSHYSELLEFCDRHKISIGRGASLLAGTGTFNNIAEKFASGTFQVTSKELAEKVASIYVAIKAYSPDAARGSRLVEALMSACRVKWVDVDRMMDRIKGCASDILTRHGTRDGYLDVLEKVYNFRMRQTMPLKFDAMKAMRERNPIHKNGKVTK